MPDDRDPKDNDFDSEETGSATTIQRPIQHGDEMLRRSSCGPKGDELWICVGKVRFHPQIRDTSVDCHSPSTDLPPTAVSRGVVERWTRSNRGRINVESASCSGGRYRPTVRQLLPTSEESVDPLDVYPMAERPTPDQRPWLMMNMVASVDGAIELDGVSGGLGGPADRLVFRAIRATADWILVAAGTVRAERYGPPRLPADAREMRTAQGRTQDPRLAVVTGRLDLDLELPLFADLRPDEPRPLIITGSSAPPDRIEMLSDVAELVVVDDRRPSPPAVLHELHSRGATVVLAEGGPSFNGQLASHGLIDELCLSISPLVAGGPSGRIISGAEAIAPAAMVLDHLLEQDGFLFARYVRR